MAFRITLLFLALIVTCSSAMQLVFPPENVCYAIDESGSITAAQFTQQTNALVSITNAFDALAVGSTYAAAGFDDVSTVLSQPTTDLPTFIQRLQSNTQSGGATSSGSGSNQCRDLLINQPEPRIIVLITDGGDNTDPRGTAVYQGIKDQGFSIATVGVGNGAQDNILQNTIASRPVLFTKVDDFSAFPAAINSILQSLCTAVTPTPSVSATPSASVSATPSVSPTPSSSMSPSPSATPAFDDCSACKMSSQCKSGVCYKH